ncbi:hypothetical protein SISNIDRAFT_489029 [Sistotremastrum niveocremeum HHB9708]|uniref:Uncharacterized protein n=1 Tax=Sistotremastrum niveocremeum HHB9708 TaxID=1314777 RepID=A0A164QEP0_9AGAM|nr:hypothetical protein SISNIDRAFT_489029 [Sistotremastrum niveocremeum HHB9708]
MSGSILLHPSLSLAYSVQSLASTAPTSYAKLSSAKKKKAGKLHLRRLLLLSTILIISPDLAVAPSTLNRNAKRLDDFLHTQIVRCILQDTFLALVIAETGKKIILKKFYSGDRIAGPP